MRSRPEPADVFPDLGTKVCDGFSVAVDRTRADLAEYRSQAVRLASRHSATGLANWIADQLMANLIEELDSFPSVDFVDGPGHTREVIIEGVSGTYYRFRAKRHHDGGSVSTYRTEGAIAFMTQTDAGLTLFDIPEVRLSVGYVWDQLLQEIGEAVVSLRDEGGRSILWMEPVPFSGAGSATVTTFPTITPVSPTVPNVDIPADGPSLPVIDLPDLNNDDSADGGRDQT